jgi:hypothetical protein
VPTGRGKTSGHAHSKPDAAVKQPSIPEALFSAYTKELPFPAASRYVTDLKVP